MKGFVRGYALACVLVLASSSVLAQEVFSINISPMSRHDAIIALASQTGHEILFVVGAIPTGQFAGKSGKYSLVEALAILLAGGDFNYTLENKQIRLVRKAKKSQVLPKITVMSYLRDATSGVT